MKNAKRVIDITGKKFGLLTVVELDHSKTGHKTYWICRCDCGNVKSVRSDSLKDGSIRSCGCLKRIQNKTNLSRTTHGMSHTRLYGIWSGMRQRCYNKNEACWARYGGRGITVCDEWLDSFEKFAEWAIGNGYDEDLTIDRIDNSGPYSPDNCRWVNASEQCRNRRTNIDITIGNSTRTLVEWCEIFELSYKTVYARYRRNKDCTLEGLFNS